MPLDVICPGCGECYHETTKSFKSGIDANAGMIRLKEPWKSYGWTEPPPDPTAGYGFLECPQCGAQLAPSGHLMVRKQVLPPGQLPNNSGKGKWICPVCQREFKSKANLGAHMRVHK